MLLTVLCMVGAAGSAAAETKLMVVSDLHYLAPPLYQGSDSSCGRCGRRWKDHAIRRGIAFRAVSGNPV
jgi:hypothetical protein